MKFFQCMNGFEHNICPGQSKNLHLRSFIVTPQRSYMNLRPWLLDLCSHHKLIALPLVHLRFRIIVWKETGFEEYTGTSLVGLRRLPQFCQIVDFQNALSTNNFFHKLNWMVPLNMISQKTLLWHFMRKWQLQILKWGWEHSFQTGRTSTKIRMPLPSLFQRTLLQLNEIEWTYLSPLRSAIKYVTT